MIQQLAQLIAASLQLNYATTGIWLVIAIKVGIVAAVFLPAISVIAMFSIWWERKVSGHIQSRLGPMHTGGWHGWSQSIADGIKLILKEDLMPDGADPFLFRLAPYLAFAPVFAAFVALPFGPQFTFEAGLNIGVLYLLAVLSVEVMGVILAGWGSNSKWAIYGAMREACQMVSYEIPLGISIICGVIVAGTLDLGELSYLQGKGIWAWFAFHNPFIFLAFFLYFIASLASNKRAPFDLPESESELVAGFHTEYSGLRFSFFFFAEYAGMFIVGAIQAALFMGAWNSPMGKFDPIYHLIGYDPVFAGQAYFNGVLASAHGWEETAGAMGLPGVPALVLLNLYCVFWFVIKAYAVIFTQMWLRWTLPRIRIDQVLYICVKVLLPASIIALVGTAMWVLLVPQPLPGLVHGDRIARLGHLTSDTPRLQFLTQFVLMALGVGACLFFVGVIFWAWVHRDKQPRQSFFASEMPVGPDIAFNPGKPQAATPETT
ncbi:MAG: NADH-quinone oxidoreductase subunit NuoH [Planctomycetes bacterium]|nr:NADH-quinone oxidoreductase subunit NuoH [Planctomycetota bacterium]